MNKEIDLWQFVGDRLEQNQPVMLLVVAESTGSSPGRRGYKMAVGSDGELTGSIGGGVMEVKLVDQAINFLSDAVTIAKGFREPEIREQVHQKNAVNASGMICSGRQTVIVKQLTLVDRETVKSIIKHIDRKSVV